MVRTGATFADACAEFLRYMEHDLDRKPSTLGDYRSTVNAHLLPAFGALRLEDVSAERIEAFTGTLRNRKSGQSEKSCKSALCRKRSVGGGT